MKIDHKDEKTGGFIIKDEYSDMNTPHKYADWM